MPKQKTHRGAAKRFSLTKTGKVKHKSMNCNHILNKKTTKLKRSLRMPTYADKTNVKQIKRLLPYQ